MNQVDDTEGGCYLVTTVSGSRYWLDLDRRKLVRWASLGPGTNHSMRHDAEEVDLIELVQCELGLPLVLLINLDLPGVWLTTRESTAVMRIDPLPDPMVHR